jgi:hypothetical protein
MTDPNAIYKEKFRELTELLGRTPTTRDSGWMALQEEYKKAWTPAEETVKAPRVTPVESAREGQSREAVGEPLSGPGIIQTGEAAVSEPGEGDGAPRVCEGLIEGDRGPGGGIMARCVGCGQLWERPARRGRPAIKCEECR